MQGLRSHLQEPQLGDMGSILPRTTMITRDFVVGLIINMRWMVESAGFVEMLGMQTLDNMKLPTESMQLERLLDLTQLDKQ